MILYDTIRIKRKAMGMHNKVLGWINLVDEFGYIRWQAHGNATEEELQTLMALTDRLLTNSK